MRKTGATCHRRVTPKVITMVWTYNIIAMAKEINEIYACDEN